MQSTIAVDRLTFNSGKELYRFCSVFHQLPTSIARVSPTPSKSSDSTLKSMSLRTLQYKATASVDALCGDGVGSSYLRSMIDSAAGSAAVGNIQ